MTLFLCVGAFLFGAVFGALGVCYIAGMKGEKDDVDAGFDR